MSRFPYEAFEHMPKMLTVPQASELTGLSCALLRKLCISGEVAHIKSGRKILINSIKLAEYLNRGN